MNTNKGLNLLKKQAVLILLIALLLGLLSACANGNNAPASVENSEASALSGKISFASNSFDRLEDIKLLAKEFMEAHPGTEIEIEGIQDVEKTLKTRLAAKELPDIGVVPKSLLKSQWNQYYMPLDDLGFTAENLYFFNNGLGDDGKLYNMTCILTFAGIVYSKKAFADAGITEVPRTVEELLAASAKLKAAGITPMATSFKDKFTLNWYTQWDYVYAGPGDADGLSNLASQDELLYEGGAVLEGLNLLKMLKDGGYVESDLISASFEQTKKDIAVGKTAMTYLGTWFPLGAADFGAKPEDFGMFPVPGAKAVFSGQDWMYGISKDTKHPELSKAFMKFLWEEGRYANAVSGLSPVKTVKSDVEFVNELLGYGVPVVEGRMTSDEYTNVFNKAQISYEDMAQEYLLSENQAAVIAKYNEKWKAGRAAAGVN